MNEYNLKLFVKFILPKSKIRRLCSEVTSQLWRDKEFPEINIMADITLPFNPIVFNEIKIHPLGKIELEDTVYNVTENEFTSQVVLDYKSLRYGDREKEYVLSSLFKGWNFGPSNPPQKWYKYCGGMVRSQEWDDATELLEKDYKIRIR